jgi:hypothetical protein
MAGTLDAYSDGAISKSEATATITAVRDEAGLLRTEILAPSESLIAYGQACEDARQLLAEGVRNIQLTAGTVLALLTAPSEGAYISALQAIDGTDVMMSAAAVATDVCHPT